MRVILRETIEALGIIGSEVTVADGYARNYLLPQNKAVLATPQSRRALEQEKTKFELQIAKEKAHAEQMAERLSAVSCTIKARVSEEDNLYGSVAVRDILDALAEQDVKLEKRMILLKEPIKKLGSYKVPVRVYRDVEPEILVQVVSDKEEKQEKDK